jgi:hypothetical protein
VAWFVANLFLIFKTTSGRKSRARQERVPVRRIAQGMQERLQNKGHSGRADRLFEFPCVCSGIYLWHPYLGSIVRLLSPDELSEWIWGIIRFVMGRVTSTVSRPGSPQPPQQCPHRETEAVEIAECFTLSRVSKTCETRSARLCFDRQDVRVGREPGPPAALPTVKSPRPRRTRKFRQTKWCRRCCLGRRPRGRPQGWLHHWAGR